MTKRKVTFVQSFSSRPDVNEKFAKCLDDGFRKEHVQFLPCQISEVAENIFDKNFVVWKCRLASTGNRNYAFANVIVFQAFEQL